MSFSTALLCLLASRALAAPASGQEGAIAPVFQDGILQLSVLTIPVEEELAKVDVTKRQVPAGLDNVKFSGYKPVVALGAVLEFGTPPQKIVLEPDTGSSNLWVPGVSPGQARKGSKSVFFDRDGSSSVQDLNKISRSDYASEHVILNMMSDEVSVGGVPMGKLNFGVGNMSHSHTQVGRLVGVMGLLPPIGGQPDGDFVPHKLLDKKLVKSKAFSMALRKKGRGLLTFGGYDTSKFSGTLEKLPLVPSKKNHYMVEMKSLAFNAGGGGSSEIAVDSQSVQGRSLNIGIDSGAPVLLLKTALFKALQAKIGATVSGITMQVGCDVVDANASLDFRMTDSTTVSIPLQDFVFEKANNNKTCLLAIQPYNRVPADLWIGGHFLRRSLVVYDPDDKTIYVARGADCGSTLVAIDRKMPTDVVKGKCSEETPESETPSADALASAVALTPEQIAAIIDPRIDIIE